VTITADDGSVVERGAAALSSSVNNQWLYTTTAAASAAVTIGVEAVDLAGQVGSATIRSE
jgi:hypothetical protein